MRERKEDGGGDGKINAPFSCCLSRLAVAALAFIRVIKPSRVLHQQGVQAGGGRARGGGVPVEEETIIMIIAATTSCRRGTGVRVQGRPLAQGRKDGVRVRQVGGHEADLADRGGALVVVVVAAPARAVALSIITAAAAQL